MGKIYKEYLNIAIMEPHHQLIVYQYVLHCIETKDPKPLRFHKKYVPFNRKQSTFNVLIKAVREQVIFPPRLFCLQEVCVELIEHKNALLVHQFEEATKSEETQYALLLLGSHSLLRFKKAEQGINANLTYATCVTPTFPSKKKIADIDPCSHEPGNLPAMHKPANWDNLDWQIYVERNNPLTSSMKVASKVGCVGATVLNRYKKIIKDCSIWAPFFPLGYENYTQYLLSFKTDYETGFLEELKKIDRSSYLYKIDDTLLLNLFFEKHLEIDSILNLEKNGVIHNLGVSSPMYHYNKYEF